MTKKVKKQEPKKPDYELCNQIGEAFASTATELILSGGSETGKTLALCLKAHTICASVPKAQGAIVRKAFNSLVGTVVQTFLRVIQFEKRGGRVFGGTKPERFIYPNGSQIWLGGMDNPQRVLSSERDFIYVCQSEELTLNDWEMLASRTTGRGAVVKHAQLFGDCNPGGSKHWIRTRAEQGRLKLFNSTHKDNPSLYTRDGVLTPDGAVRMAALENALTGVRRLRLLGGIWATAEGAVYEMFNGTRTGQISDHVQDRNPEEMKRWFLCQDDGWTNPAVVLLVGADSDGRWHVFREWYERQRPRLEAVAVARAWCRCPALAAQGATNDVLDATPPHDWQRCEVDAVDAAQPELVAALNSSGVPASPGKGKIMDGIRKIQDRLKVQGDGRPRLTIAPGCVNTINEFESYVWKDGKDVPVDEFNHSLDSLRYLEDVLAQPTGVIMPADVAGISTGQIQNTGRGARTFTPRSWNVR